MAEDDLAEVGMAPRDMLEGLLELASRAELEVRTLTQAASAADFSPTESSACRVGERVWVVLAPDDPLPHQISVLAGALGRFRAEFLEDNFVAPGVRDFIERALGSGPGR